MYPLDACVTYQENKSKKKKKKKIKSMVIIIYVISNLITLRNSDSIEYREALVR